MARDPYLELGVSRTASAAEIRKAFHKLAKQHHPDANKGDKKSEEKFKQVSAAGVNNFRRFHLVWLQVAAFVFGQHAR